LHKTIIIYPSLFELERRSSGIFATEPTVGKRWDLYQKLTRKHLRRRRNKAYNYYYFVEMQSSLVNNQTIIRRTYCRNRRWMGEPESVRGCPMLDSQGKETWDDGWSMSLSIVCITLWCQEVPVLSCPLLYRSGHMGWCSLSWGISLVVGEHWAAWHLLENWDREDRDIGLAESVALELAILWMSNKVYLTVMLHSEWRHQSYGCFQQGPLMKHIVQCYYPQNGVMSVSFQHQYSPSLCGFLREQSWLSVSQ